MVMDSAWTRALVVIPATALLWWAAETWNDKSSAPATSAPATARCVTVTDGVRTFQATPVEALRTDLRPIGRIWVVRRGEWREATADQLPEAEAHGWALGCPPRAH